MKRLVSSIASIVCALIPAAASAQPAMQFAKPDDAIKYRQSAFFLMGQHAGRINAMVQGRTPYDPKLAAEHAEAMAFASKLPYVAFIEGTDKGGNTRAKSEIWSEQDKFRSAATRMQDEVAKLSSAAKSGSLDQLKAAWAEASKTCKGCHDSYRRD